MNIMAIAGGVIAVAAVLAIIYVASDTEPPESPAAEPVSAPKPKPIATQLDSPYITEYELLKDSAPNGITVDNNGTVWVVASNSSMLMKFDPRNERFTEFKIPTDATLIMAWGMLADRDNKIWFTDEKNNVIWQFDPATETFTNSTLLTKRSEQGLPAFPLQLTEDRTGIWYTLLFGNKIGIVSKEDPRFIQEFSPATDSSGPSGLFIREGQVWFTQAFANRVGVLNQAALAPLYLAGHTSPGMLLEFAPDETLYSPTGLYIDNKGTMWITEHGASLVSGYKLSTGSLFRFATSINEHHETTLPYWLRHDSSGNIWFNQHTGNRIATFDIENYKLTEYEVPTRDPEYGYMANVLNLATAPDGRVWFTALTADKIGVVDPSVPIPFDIDAVRKVEVSRGGSVTIPLSISKAEDFMEELTPLVSSSTTFTGKLANMTAIFKPAVIKPDTQQLELVINTDRTMKLGNYTITVGVTDGLVIRSVVIEFVVQERV